MLLASAAPAVAVEPVVDIGYDVEARADADFDGDGKQDIAYITGNGEVRNLYITLADGESELLALESSPLGPGSLSFAKGVLIFEDLTGGTTAYSTVRRYRFDPAADRMRLIGFDTALYSRTYAHDGFELSWNLLTSKLITRELHLNEKGGEAAYDPIVERTTIRKSGKVWLSETPDPETLMADVRQH
jgi:hypothetical protein